MPINDTPLFGLEPPPQNQGFIPEMSWNSPAEFTMALHNMYFMFAPDYMNRDWAQRIALKDDQQKTTYGLFITGWIMNLCFGGGSFEEADHCKGIDPLGGRRR
jgi:hypothetical protein